MLEAVFNTLVSEVNNDLKPDLVIVSGDLTDDGLIFQFEKAKEEIERFKCPNLIVFPGSVDPMHRWVATYNQRLVSFLRFFKWYYYRDKEPAAGPIVPACPTAGKLPEDLKFQIAFRTAPNFFTYQGIHE
jgi:3',5'-cyclic AMP phosphodiesterase CpdA